MLTARKLEDAYRAVLATNASEALALVNTIRPDLCVLDYHLPGITGLELGFPPSPDGPVPTASHHSDE